MCQCWVMKLCDWMWRFCLEWKRCQYKPSNQMQSQLKLHVPLFNGPHYWKYRQFNFLSLGYCSQVYPRWHLWHAPALGSNCWKNNEYGKIWCVWEKLTKVLSWLLQAVNRLMQITTSMCCVQKSCFTCWHWNNCFI